MIFLKKALSWLKAHWMIPLLAIVALITFIMTREKSLIDIKRVLREAGDSHRAEVKVIESTAAREKEANDLAVHRMHETERLIIEEFARNQQQLDGKKLKRVREITKQFKDDPDALARQIEKDIGVRVVVLK